MNKKLINKGVLNDIIANSNICQHAIKELKLAGYGKGEGGPNDWIMAVSADSTELLFLSCDYNIKWEQVSCLKGIRLEDVTPELKSKAYAELKNNKH